MDHVTGHRRDNPSFSSTLLDAIYRSIDKEGEDDKLFTMNSSSFSRIPCMKDEEETAPSLRKASVVDMNVVVNEKHAMRRKISMAECDRKLRDDSIMLKSSSSSSESSSAGGFSSPESESIYISNNSKSSCYSMQRPKPIRTSVSNSTRHQKPQMNACHQSSQYNRQNEKSNHAAANQNPKHENGLVVKTKSKARKIYGDLKRAKQQPISPGGRLASFLNSLFTAGNVKKAKVSSTARSFDNSSSSEMKSKYGHESTTTCSSVSSFSRSCLSKTPASSKGSSTKRSVRFFPVSVILDEDYRVHKSLYEDQRMSSKKDYISGEELKFHALEESRRVGEAARALLNKYQMMKDGFDNVESDEDEDAASCASSDLFELDNLSSIGIDQRYTQELPVYETTHLDHANLAIANDFMV